MLHKSLSTLFAAAGVALLLLVFTGIQPHAVRAQSDFPTAPWELISLSNSYRVSHGNAPLEEHSTISAVAQNTASQMASLQSCRHLRDLGYGGVSERLVQAGYNNTGLATENIICSTTALGDPYADFNRWGDPDHMHVVLNTHYRHIGAGAARGSNNIVYYVLIAAAPSRSSNNPPAAQPAGPTATRALIFAVQTATPMPDGKIVHVVQSGQAVFSIATAYGVTVADIIALNNLSTGNPVIFPGQELVIRIGATPTVSPTATETSPPATRTPAPTATRPPPLPTRTPTLEPSETPKPLLPDLPASLNSQALGIGFIVVCGLGLAALVINTIRSRGSA